MGSCNGLLCISGSSHNLFLWNPSIRKFKELPLSGSDVHSSSYMAMVLVIMSVKMIIVEVMGILHSDYGFQNEFRIYSVRTNSWEMIQEYPGIIFCTDPAKYVNGRLHRIATREN